MVVVAIRRPAGNIEEVKTDMPSMYEARFEAIKKATAEAQRGEVLSWRYEHTPFTPEQIAEWEADCADQKAFRDTQRSIHGAMTMNGTSN